MTQKPRHDVLPVILAGGSGTRLWPLSRALHPKQYLAFDSKETLFQQAVMRVCALAGDGIVLGKACVVANEEHRFTVVDQLRVPGHEVGQLGARVGHGALPPQPNERSASSP